VLASTNAPVHTDITTSALCSTRRTHSSFAGRSARNCAPITTIAGCGAVSKVWSVRAGDNLRCVLKHLPRPSEIDDSGAVVDQEGPG
jgi:hypothetical protein